MIYIVLCKFCYGEKTSCFPTHETLAKQAGNCSVATVKKALKKLVEYGLILKETKGYNRSNTYEVIDIYNDGYIGTVETHVDNYINKHINSSCNNCMVA